MAAMLLAAPGCASTSHSPTASSAPDFELRSLGGPLVRLSEHTGRVVLIAFFTSWSKPSRALIDVLKVLDRRHAGAGLSVLAVALDGPDTQAAVASRTRGSHFAVLLDDDGAVGAMFDPTHTVPFIVLIARDGHIVRTWSGFLWDEGPELERAVGHALETPTGGAR